MITSVIARSKKREEEYNPQTTCKAADDLILKSGSNFENVKRKGPLSGNI